MILEVFLAILLLALVMEFIDAGLGMGYGTVISPVLIIAGYSPFLVIPSLLFSQAIGGLIASVFHEIHDNAHFKLSNYEKIKKQLSDLGYFGNLKKMLTKDTKIVFLITILGIVATIFGAMFAVNIPKTYIKLYIGLLVITMGIMMLFNKIFDFSWNKIVGLSILGSFNKGISGGGFGPVLTGGQIISGNEKKSSIATTVFSEAPICITGFIVYLLMVGMSSYGLLIALTIGSICGAPFGAFLTKKIKSKELKLTLGITLVILGSLTLVKLII